MYCWVETKPGEKRGEVEPVETAAKTRRTSKVTDYVVVVRAEPAVYKRSLFP